jgi:DNA integrity scanning protein DisA with diadenylate cyclase activity
MIDRTVRIEEIKRLLKVIGNKISKLSKEEDTLSKELEKLVEERKEEVNFKVWKAMENKYYHVWLFTISEEDKFKKCQYVHVIKVEKDLLRYEYINYDETCMYFTMVDYNHIHERGYRAWTEISKKEYEKIISSTKNLERLESGNKT